VFADFSDRSQPALELLGIAFRGSAEKGLPAEGELALEMQVVFVVRAAELTKEDVTQLPVEVDLARIERNAPVSKERDAFSNPEPALSWQVRGE
jgi:hypothetical protein